MVSRLIALPALAALLALPIAAQAADPMPTPDCHGQQITDKQGDSVNSLDGTSAGSPSSDLTAGWWTFDPSSGKATADIRVANLTAGEVDPPYDGISWEYQFSVNNKALFLRAFTDVSGIAKFT